MLFWAVDALELVQSLQLFAVYRPVGQPGFAHFAFWQMCMQPRFIAHNDHKTLQTDLQKTIMNSKGGFRMGISLSPMLI